MQCLNLSFLISDYRDELPQGLDGETDAGRTRRAVPGLGHQPGSDNSFMIPDCCLSQGHYLC